MTDNTDRKPLVAYLPAPMSILLGVAFFLPWIRISCDAKAVSNAPMPPGAPALPTLPAGVFEDGEMATISGWQLARGELTPSVPDAMAEQVQARQKGLPRARAWAYGGIIAPVLVLLVTMAALAGKITHVQAGKWTAALAVVGVVVAMLGTSVDFVGDTLDQARAEFDKHMTGPLPPGADAMMDVAMEQAETELGKVIQTEATPWLWGTMALWGGLAVCGVMIASGPGVAGASTSTSACRMTHTPYRREDAPASGGAPRRGNARGVPASRPNHAPAPRAPVGSALPDFGPSLAPLASASVPASPAEPTEDEHGTSHEDDDPPEPPSPGRALCEPY